MASLGQELKRERELRAISLKDISGQTRINARYLQALEDDKLDQLPGAFFIKSVLRSYSKCIGVDENYFVNKYHQDVLIQEDAQEKERRKNEFIPSEPKKKKIWPWILALLLAIIVAACAAAYVFIIKPQKDNRPVLRKPPAPALEQQITPPEQLRIVDPAPREKTANRKAGR
jgi:cytoskeletal protein RodZ